ncbi:hypothetical protein MATL_G00102610 [Megalops atlanticus]|uniref:Uncharacterized protein n=1 Tax=Megalops atlanticus TaxID=7932 RepID=A0A9D3PYE9_MEGAT|nr:hypothetical protein MATL_G00102610 [Megalops atlanticus]
MDSFTLSAAEHECCHTCSHLFHYKCIEAISEIQGLSQLVSGEILRTPASRGHSTSEQPIAALQNLVRSIAPVTPPGFELPQRRGTRNYPDRLLESPTFVGGRAHGVSSKRKGREDNTTHAEACVSAKRPNSWGDGIRVIGKNKSNHRQS